MVIRDPIRDLSYFWLLEIKELNQNVRRTGERMRENIKTPFPSASVFTSIKLSWPPGCRVDVEEKVSIRHGPWALHA